MVLCVVVEVMMNVEKDINNLLETLQVIHRERKSVFLPTSINQFHRNEIIEVKRMRKGKWFPFSNQSQI